MLLIAIVNDDEEQAVAEATSAAVIPLAREK